MAGQAQPKSLPPSAESDAVALTAACRVSDQTARCVCRMGTAATRGFGDTRAQMILHR